MGRVKFERDYDHRWPSGAVTAYRANWEGPVKTEVAEAAVAAGVARRTKHVPAPDDKPKPRRRGRPRKTAVVGIQGGKIDEAEPAPTLPEQLPPELADPQALTPNLHVNDETE